MDDRLGRFGLNFPSRNAFDSLAKYHNDNTFQIDSAGSCLSALNSKGTKRKLCDIVGSSKESILLELTLGRPSSSSDSCRKSSATACTMSLTKETDDSSSVDLGLNFDFSLGKENICSTEKHVLAVPNPKLDLQLSLSICRSESGITGVIPVPENNYLLNGKLYLSQEFSHDEGSTSSRRKHGNKVMRFFGSPEKAGTVLLERKIYGIPPAGMLEKGQKVSAATTGVTHTQQRCSYTKNCQAPGCPKGARGASGLCIAHGGGRRCQKAGCLKGAEGRTIFCKTHGGGRRCQFLGCTKSAEGRTEYCVAHGGGRRCSHEGCTKAARGKSGFCIKHGGGKRCQKENCTKSAEGHSGLCIAHGGGRRCQYPECPKGAQGSTSYCKAHGGGKRCTFEGCAKGAEGSTPFCKAHGGGKRCAFQGGCTKSVHGGTQFCVAHGGGKRCAILDCTRSARGRTNYCVRHGGGKRCKVEGCGKSAQGSTDFCKAHGGGRRCLWGQAGSNVGNGAPPCDRFVRGKKGLCDSHTPLVEDHRVHGEVQLVGVNSENLAVTKSEKEYVLPSDPLNARMVPLPEGRVHGGNLMALLASSASPCEFSVSQVDDCPSEQVKANIVLGI